MQLDTGSSLNILPYKQLKQLGMDKENLQPTNKILKDYLQDRMKPLGEIELRARYKKIAVNAKFYIVELEQIPLISNKLCVDLGLVKRIHSTSVKTEMDSTDFIEKMYPDVKMTTGVMPMKLDIDPDAEPVVQGPRQQPKALLPAITLKLKEMEEECFIKKVTEPTEWASSMAVFEKNGKIRICIDPSNVNKAIKRSIYPDEDSGAGDE